MSNDAFANLVEEQLTEMAKERAHALYAQIVWGAWKNGEINKLTRDDLILVATQMNERIAQLESALTPKLNADAVYPLFRQYMANDLGIGSDEIRAMINQYMDIALPKLLGQMNIEGDVHSEVRKITYNTVLSEARAAWRERLSNTKMEIRVEGAK
jgi:hypothetical protein